MNKTEIEILRTNIQAQLKNKSIAPLCISGEPGTAKSTTVALIAKELGMNLATESAPCLTHEILSGLPDTIPAGAYQENSIDGSAPQATVWSIPEMLAKAIRLAKNKPTVLLIDDFHMVSPHLQAYFYGLLLERRLGNYKLSDNIAIILTMNNSAEAGFNGINSAVRNRMSILPIKFNFEHWFENFGNRLHYLVASFLKAKPQFCQEDESTGIEGYATARAWTAGAIELGFHSDEFVKAHAGTLLGMQVSKEAASAFQAHVNYVAAIDFTQVVKSRTLIDLATKDPMDSIIYSYITNFIQSIDDGIYMLDLMEHNKHEAASTFIGFVIGELFIKYTGEEEMSDGLKFVIARLLGTKMNPADYPSVSKEKLEKAFNHSVPSISTFQERAAEFLL